MYTDIGWSPLMRAVVPRTARSEIIRDVVLKGMPIPLRKIHEAEWRGFVPTWEYGDLEDYLCRELSVPAKQAEELARDVWELKDCDPNDGRLTRHVNLAHTLPTLRGAIGDYYSEGRMLTDEELSGLQSWIEHASKHRDPNMHPGLREALKYELLGRAPHLDMAWLMDLCVRDFMATQARKGDEHSSTTHRNAAG